MTKLVTSTALGLDVGTKRIGIAGTDELGIAVHGIATLTRRNMKLDTGDILAIASGRNATVIVIGLALHLDGRESSSAVAARRLGEALEAAGGPRVEYWDERLTTKEAERVLIEGNVSRLKRRKVVDQLAAVLILQGWLAAQEVVR